MPRTCPSRLQPGVLFAERNPCHYARVAAAGARQRPWSDALWTGWLLFPFTFPVAFWFIGARASDRYWTRLGWGYAIPVVSVVVAAGAGAGNGVGVPLLLVLLLAWVVALVQGFRALPRYRAIRRDGAVDPEEEVQQLSLLPESQGHPVPEGRPLPFPPSTRTLPSPEERSAKEQTGETKQLPKGEERKAKKRARLAKRQEVKERREHEREEKERLRVAKRQESEERREQERERKEHARREAARAADLAKSLRPSGNLWTSVGDLERALTEANLRPRQSQRLRTLAMNTYCEEALADDILTVSEERQLDELLKRLDVEPTRDLTIRLVLAGVNDGRLPVASDVPIILRTNEKAHLCLGAGLIGDVTRTRYRGGSRGVSVPIGLGIRVRTGSYSGRAVSRTTAEVVDRGTLVVTSERVVFVGGKNTIEMALKRLVSLNAGSNEVQFHVSNRQKASTLRIDRKLTDVVAAVVAQAAARVQ
jgi:hypothetical protein